MADDSQGWLADLQGRMEAESRARAAHPSSFLVEILRHYWMDCTAEEAQRLWRTTVRDNPGYAIDVLNCLYVISQNPPPELPSLMEQGGVSMYEDAAKVPYSRHQYARWLSNVHDEWHRVFSSARPAG